MTPRNRNPLVSAIIPTFNRAYCLRNAIDTVLQQTHSPMEAIVIDDGSTDDTGKLIEQYYGDDSRVRYFYQPNKGVSAARNLGISHAKGDYLAFLDSDDLWKPWKIELQLSALQRFPEAGMIWTDMEAVDAQNAIVSAAYLKEMYSAWRWFENNQIFAENTSLAALNITLPTETANGMVFAGSIGSPMIMGNLVHTSTALLSRKRVDEVGQFDESLSPSGEDYDFHLRTCRAGMVAFVDVSSIQYRVGAEDQLTRPEMGVHIAKNFLKTILPIITHDRASIRLRGSMIRRVLSEAYAWIGQEELARREYGSALRNFATSLRYRPWQPRLVATVGTILLPTSITESALEVCSVVKSTFF
jgi:GT2 family glycosyltransferase